MAERTILEDDIDGTLINEGEGDKIFFSVGDRHYRIDLSTKNIAKFEKALAPFVDKATEIEEAPPEPAVVARRKTVARAAVSPGRGGSGLSKEELQAVRDWAKAQGIEVAAKGRIAASVIEQYEAAHKR